MNRYAYFVNSTVMGEVIFLEKLTTVHMGNCFKIKAFFINEYIKNSNRYINLYFNESSTQVDFHSLEVFFTSEKNSYGVVRNYWRNGKVIITHVHRGMFKSIDLKIEQYRYMTTATGIKCSNE